MDGKNRGAPDNQDHPPPALQDSPASIPLVVVWYVMGLEEEQGLRLILNAVRF